MDRNQIVEVPPSMRYLIFCAHLRVCACTHTTGACWHNHLCFLTCIWWVWLDLCVDRYLSTLKRLTLAHNKIKGKWTFFPISCLSNLTELRLTGNELPEPPTGVARYHCLHVSGFACVCLHVIIIHSREKFSKPGVFILVTARARTKGVWSMCFVRFRLPKLKFFDWRPVNQEINLDMEWGTDFLLCIYACIWLLLSTIPLNQNRSYVFI